MQTPSDISPRTGALVVGVGASQGLGAAVARRLAREGLAVWIMGRSPDSLATVAADIEASGGEIHAVVGDATVEGDVARLFAEASAGRELAIAVFNAGNNRPRPFLDTDPEFFEDVWRVVCFAGHLFALQAAKTMLPNKRGTVLFTGASASLRARAGFEAFASAKAGLRAVAQAMAREFGPQNIHVAHVVIDGGIDGERVNTRFPNAKSERPPDGLLSLDAIAEAYWRLHEQHRSAWTHELDLRPYCEAF